MSTQFPLPGFSGISGHPPHQICRRIGRLALALCGTVLAAQDKLTPATLNAWRAIGGVAVVAQAQGTVAVSAGGEIMRTFAAGPVSVRLVSRPFFSPAPTGWPALEVGPASLTFVRDKTGGAMVLLGDKPLSLPFVIPLGADGRSAELLEFTLSYDQTGNLATLVLAAERFTLTATAPPGPVSVVVSAGAEQTWVLDTLEIQAASASAALPTETTAASNTLGAATNPAFAVVDAVAPGTQDFETSRALFQTGDIAGAEKLLFASNLALPGTGAWALESGIRLMYLAASLANCHDPANARAAAAAAVTLLQQAESLLLTEGKRITAGRAQSLIGTLSEFFLHDDVAAQKAYLAALSDDPNSVGAKNASARFESLGEK